MSDWIEIPSALLLPLDCFSTLILLPQLLASTSCESCRRKISPPAQGIPVHPTDIPDIPWIRRHCAVTCPPVVGSPGPQTHGLSIGQGPRLDLDPPPPPRQGASASSRSDGLDNPQPPQSGRMGLICCTPPTPRHSVYAFCVTPHRDVANRHPPHNKTWIPDICRRPQTLGCWLRGELDGSPQLPAASHCAAQNISEQFRPSFLVADPSPASGEMLPIRRV